MFIVPYLESRKPCHAKLSSQCHQLWGAVSLKGKENGITALAGHASQSVGDLYAGVVCIVRNATLHVLGIWVVAKVTFVAVDDAKENQLVVSLGEEGVELLLTCHVLMDRKERVRSCDSCSARLLAI